MSKYTTTLRFIIESGYELQAFKNFPIYNENQREYITSAIINHFYFREIGFETVAMFDWYLSTTLNEIMPYYNKLFEAIAMEIDPIHNHVYEENSSSEGQNSGNSNSTNNGLTKNIYSKPADGSVNLNDIAENMYANDVTFNKDNSNNNYEYGGTNKNIYTKNAKATMGISQSEMIAKYKRNMFSVIQLLVNDKELNQCFMGVY